MSCASCHLSNLVCMAPVQVSGWFFFGNFSLFLFICRIFIGSGLDAFVAYTYCKYFLPLYGLFYLFFFYYPNGIV